MRRRWQGGRLVLLALGVAVCVALIGLSALGVLAPLEGIAAAPLNFISGALNRAGVTLSTTYDDLTDDRSKDEYIAELEEALSGLQSEVVGLREIASDYYRLADLVSYATTATDQEFVTADVTGRSTTGSLRTITINVGTRDGIRVGMAVVVREGLVGRVIEVTSNSATVMLVISEASAISARLQTSRIEGSVIGLATGNMRMEMLPLTAEVAEGDLVITSGLGSNFPADLVIGQVTSTRSFESAIEQTAEIRSLVNFDRLEMVMVITSFQPVDQSIFEDTEETSPES